MALNKALEAILFDVRMTEYNLNHGIISKEDLAKKLASLPDDAALVSTTALEDFDTEEANSQNQAAH